jgi:AcrR family transcriptional regulator
MSLAQSDSVVAATDDSVIRNLNGQKLGRKGRDTRARVIATAAALVAEGQEVPLTLSAVARQSGLGLTSLYLYFGDLTELLLAVLEPVTAATESYLKLIRPRWSDEELAEQCRAFAAAYYAYWQEHSRILHLRSSLADQNDQRMLQQRIDASQELISLLAAQMNGDMEQPQSPSFALAVMLVTGIERAASIRTDLVLPGLLEGRMLLSPERFLHPAARILELGIRDARTGA